MNMANWAAEIRIRATRKYGLMRMEMEKCPAGRHSDPIGSSVEPIKKPPTISELGVSKSFDHRAQKIARVPDEEFEAVIAECKESGKELTGATIQR